MVDAPLLDKTVEQHTLSILVDNEPGVLARVIGLFSGRGYNIESLTVSEISHKREVSRITVVTRGTPQVIAQISAQLERIIPVHRVKDLTASGDVVERELALIKVVGVSQEREEALRLAIAFKAVVCDASSKHFVFELTGRSKKVDQFIDLMRPLGLVSVARTGVAAVSRGPDAM